ncbi:MAG: transposase, partial [Anaerolineae bacterium]
MLAERLKDIQQISHESVRRLLGARDVLYRQAKAWLTSPAPHYALHKAQRDRLPALARAAPDGAAVWLDQAWFSRWPYRFRAWAEGQPNTTHTVQFLETFLAHYQALGKRFIVLLWDHAPWHTSRAARCWVRAYNRRAKREGLTRLVLC